MALRRTSPHRSGVLARRELSRPHSCRYWFPRAEIDMAAARPFRSLVSDMRVRNSVKRALTSETNEASVVLAAESGIEARRSPPAKSAGPGTTESSLALTNLIAWDVSCLNDTTWSIQLTRLQKLPKLARSSLLLAAIKLDHRKAESFVSGRCEMR